MIWFVVYIGLVLAFAAGYVMGHGFGFGSGYSQASKDLAGSSDEHAGDYLE